jgi:hypothetical protein
MRRENREPRQGEKGCHSGNDMKRYSLPLAQELDLMETLWEDWIKERLTKG